MSDFPNHSTVIERFPYFDVYSATYAVLVAAGGILGYTKAKSMPSLAAGLTFGLLLGGGSYLEATKGNYWLTFASSGALLGVMGPRFAKSKKLMPAGLISLFSIGMLIRYGTLTYKRYSLKSAAAGPVGKP